jgi:hypothetical protein
MSDVEHFAPPVASSQSLRSKILLKRGPKLSLAGGAGGAFYVLGNLFLEKTGLKVDPTSLSIVSVIASGVVLASTSPILVLSLRVVVLKFLLACRFISKATYDRLMKAVEQAFENAIKG